MPPLLINQYCLKKAYDFTLRYKNNIFNTIGNMKKIIIAVILLFIAFSASAQLHADLRVGTTASSFGDRHLKMGIRAGAGVEYLFSEHWGLRSGLFSR